ncbi:hypothetical protein FJT64_015414 [Amphibalanus amphitrite]|uniref:Uncharacterized protein n=1 Tax=Amphibalanus amphitrite TaxID=1232801 RepID=A0A6A4X7B9_AMPAM|nr:hypothetical protein FJT64_015414 [Amphibalanus amphitrite]
MWVGGGWEKDKVIKTASSRGDRHPKRRLSTINRQQQEQQQEQAALHSRLAQQAQLIAHYRHELVPRLRGDITRLRSESSALLGRLDVPALVVSMRSTLSQLEASLAQSHEECCRLFADVSMLKTEKALVSRELHDTERRAEALQRDAQRQSEEPGAPRSAAGRATTNRKQYKMLLESLKFKIYLETENAGMTQEANRLRYENSYLKQANRQLTEELQDVRLRLLPQELREERTEPEKRAPSPTADSPVPADFPTPETSSQSSVSLSSLPESQQRAPPPVAVQAGGRPRRQRRRDTAGGRRRVVTWGQLLEAEPEDVAADRLDTAAVTQMIQLAAAQSTELEQLGHSVELSDED